MYCGKEVTDFGDNPEDYGLHKQIDFSKLCTCNRCNELVTKTNRYIKRVLDTNGQDNTLLDLEAHILSIRKLYN